MTQRDPRPRPSDFDSDPDRFLASLSATSRYTPAGDLHAAVARRLERDHPNGRVLDLGGGNGRLARELHEKPVRTIVLDRAAYVAGAPGPRIQGDAPRLPFPDVTFDATAALWMLYHLDDPVAVMREAARTLRPGGTFVACAASRWNDPELAEVLPGWGDRSTFDAEDAVALVGEVFDVLDAEHWDAPLVTLPDADAVAEFLRGRGLSGQDAAAAARPFEVPLSVTKRGVLVWTRHR